jgi:hypothetical protein
MHKFLLVLSILLLAAGCSQEKVDIVDQTIKCEQLLQLKKSRYFGDENGQMRSIYNPQLKTCLAMNIYNNPVTGQYYGMVLDMQNDKTLYYYSVNKGELVDSKSGDSMYDMAAKIRSYGFEVTGL